MKQPFFSKWKFFFIIWFLLRFWKYILFYRHQDLKRVKFQTRAGTWNATNRLSNIKYLRFQGGKIKKFTIREGVMTRMVQKLLVFFKIKVVISAIKIRFIHDIIVLVPFFCPNLYYHEKKTLFIHSLEDIISFFIKIFFDLILAT